MTLVPRILAIPIVLVTALAVTSDTSLAARRPRPAHQLKIATLAPDGTAWMKVMREMDDAIRDATENRVGVKFYAGGVQGDELVVLRKIRLGQLHGGGFTGQGIGAVAPELRVLELPFLFQSYEEVDAVHEQLGPRLEQILAEKGYALLGWADVGFIQLFANRPVREPADLAAVKMWLWEGDPLAASFFDAFDISPIPLALPDVLTALQTGLIDGVYSSPLACVALQWHTRVQYMTDFPIVHALGAMIVDAGAWERIPAEDRTRVREVADRFFRKLVEETRAGDRDAVVTMRERGIEVVEPSVEQASTFVARGKEIWTEQAETIYPRALLDELLDVLQSVRAGDGE